MKRNGGGQLSILIAVSVILLSAKTALSAKPIPASATCRITCTVADTAEWSNTSFPSINLETLSGRNRESAGSASLSLYTNGDVKLVADNSESAQLSKDASHNLATQYKIQTDGDGASQTGGADLDWASYDRFLDKGISLKHVRGDGAVEITLSVKVSKDSFTPGDAGQYSAAQTLTACWE